MLAGGDPENHGVSGNRNDTLWCITVLFFSALKQHKFDYIFMENRIVYVDLCVWDSEMFWHSIQYWEYV